MMRVDWQAVALLAIFSAVWWGLFILSRGCGPLRPTEEAPATTPATTPDYTR
jgi:hypothetical protein